ncbi:MAG: hypothetical protein M0P69_03265 [Bacteroidales bacterium]|nr:hypothetical protein [Bacteroidales bacterium]
MDARLLFIGEYAREFAGIGVYQPGQRTQIFDYEDPAQKAKADQLLATGLFVPYDDETAALVKEETDRLQAEAEEQARIEGEKAALEREKKEKTARQKTEEEAAEAEAAAPIPATALEMIRKQKATAKAEITEKEDEG